jgi:hypothetical protein
MTGQSLLSVAGWWVAWVYALSLSMPLLLGPVAGDADPEFDALFDRWAREVVFKSPGLTVSQADPAGLAELRAVATSPAPVSGNVRVFVEDMTAKQETDFEVATRGAEIHFDKGAVEGTLRVMPGWGPDVRIVDLKKWKEPRSFRLRLQSGPDAVAAGDLAMCTVTIDDGPKPSDLDLIPVGFAREAIPVPLADLATMPIEIAAASAVAKPVPITFDVFHTLNGVRRPIGRFERKLATGERRTSFRLADVFTAEQLERAGLTDNGEPGLDETYEIDLMAPPPLFPDSPRTCRITAQNTNQPPGTKLVYFDAEKREIPYLDPEGFVTIEYDGSPLRNRSTHTVSIDGVPLSDQVVVDPRTRRGRLVSLRGFDWTGRRGRRCGVSTACGSGCCRGQAGGSGRALCGEPVPGEYMLIVVNNERLHDPDDGIVAEVRRALADEAAKPYGNGAIILNPKDEDTLTATGGGPDPKKIFEPFNEEGHDVAGQLRRIEEVVARKREAAAKPDLRAVVVWPERDLAAGAGVRPVAGPDLQPISFLLPDAAASYARDVARGLVPPGVGPGAVTVRGPKERELQAHLVNVIAEGRPSDEDSAP